MANFPQWGGAVEVDSLAVNTATSGAVAVVSAANAKGTKAQLIASTAVPYSGLILQARSGNGALASVCLYVGGAGSEVEIVSDVLAFARDYTVPVFLPVNVPAGSRLSAASQDNTGGGNSHVVNVVGVAGTPGVPTGYQRATTYGFTAATTTGTVVDAGAVANTKGSYAQLSAATTNPTKLVYVQIVCNTTAGGVNTDLLVDIATGAAASEVDVIPNLYVRNPGGVAMNHLVGPFPVSLAAGVRLAARCQASAVVDTTSRTVQVTVIALD